MEKVYYSIIIGIVLSSNKERYAGDFKNNKKYGEGNLIIIQVNAFIQTMKCMKEHGKIIKKPQVYQLEIQEKLLMLIKVHMKEIYVMT